MALRCRRRSGRANRCRRRITRRRLSHRRRRSTWSRTGHPAGDDAGVFPVVYKAEAEIDPAAPPRAG